MSAGLSLERRNEVIICRFDRPEAKNALDFQTQKSFQTRVSEWMADDSLRAVVLSGSRNVFCAGGDIRELAGMPDPETAARLTSVMRDALDDLTRLPVPVLAAVNGPARGGGCEILTACDLRIAVKEADFQFAQVRVGLVTGWGGTERLVRLVGQSRAARLLLAAERVGAPEALRLGFLHRVVDSGVVEEAVRWAGELARLPRRALAGMKTLLWNVGAEGARERERAIFADLWHHPDHAEALAAFLEKRKPKFE